MKNIDLIHQVLEASSAGTPDMTHALCRLGGGDMGSGIAQLWEAGRSSGFVRGASVASLIFSIGARIGLAFLYNYHEKALDKLESETVHECLSFWGNRAQKKAPDQNGEIPLCEMASNEDCEIIIRRRSNKK